MNLDLRNYLKIADNILNGNWRIGANIGKEKLFDAYRLLEHYDYFKDQQQEPMSLRDIAILSMYIERLRNES